MLPQPIRPTFSVSPGEAACELEVKKCGAAIAPANAAVEEDFKNSRRDVKEL